MSKLPSNCNSKEIKEICLIIKGRKPNSTTSSVTAESSPYILIESFEGAIKTFTEDVRVPMCKAEDVLMVMDGARSGLTATGFVGAIGSTLAAIRIKDKAIVNEKYLYYFLRTKYEILNSQTKGATIPHIDKHFLETLVISLPSLKTQMKIAAILERADKLRQKRDQANLMANEVFLAVFLQMFGDKPPENRIGDVSDFVSSGSTPLGGEKTYLSKGIMFIRSQNVLMNELDLESVAHISEETHKEMRRTWVKNGDVLLNITGASLGRVAIFRGEDDKANVNQHVCIIRISKQKALSEYIAAYLSMPTAQREIWTIQAGASRQALNFNQVKSLRLYLPSIEEQIRFVSVAERIRRLKENQDRSTVQMEELMDSLMIKAFKGELS